MNNFDNVKKYLSYKKRLEICEFEIRQSKKQNRINDIAVIENEIREILKSMSEIKNIINENPFTDEEGRLFLRCRYMDGLTMEKTAELLNVSRNTAYRIKKKVEGQLRNLS